ncbi:hypothetical protein ROLI_041140 [Roseobacter fucihabitans]|uniref:Calcium-binding protein n=1 Tax=Roseobacter fucihabitans TaxID=1537242 RepID=A0ABZ2BZ32_9RHOB|nr:calcium-binding protein [Roseobacter litoralis]MBC6965891.1 Bifunctional hemolysin/adenylate cyclase precursor [Roseobacter litoralis]
MAIITGTENDDQFANQLVGTNGNDEYLALGGDDFLIPSLGSDILNGGAGFDVAIYDASPLTNGIVINNTSLAIGSVLAFSVNKGSGQIDTLIDMENFHGTNFSDAIYVGGLGGTYTFDRAGNDFVRASQDPAATTGHTFVAGSGNDTYIGTVRDDDLVIYTDNGFDGAGPIFRGVDVNLATGTAVDGWGDIDSLTGIENVDGTALNDIIRGDGNNNFFIGLAGNDTLEGAGGDDGLLGGDGNDTLRGGDGNDNLRGGRGNDILDGGNEPAQFSGGDRASYSREHQDGGTQGIDASLITGTVIDTFGDTDTLINIEEIQGSIFNDLIVGAGGSDQLRGEGGNDTVTGNAGNDDLSGGSGNDTISGGAGDDFIEAGSGTDTISGGVGGFDELSYVFDTFFDGISTGVSVTFTNETDGTAIDFNGDTDSFTGIESVRGTNNADTFVGSIGTQSFRGFGGDDSFDGGAGDNDRIDYSRAHADLGAFQGVTVDMVAGTAIDAYGDNDTFVNIERIRGSDFADAITGNSDRNDLQGRDGDDVIDSFGGSNNYLEGGDGDDTLLARGQNDFVNGGNGDDTISLFENESGANPGFGSDTIAGAANGYFFLEYGGVSDSLTIDILLGTTVFSGGDIDAFTNIRNIGGGDGDDILLGDNSSEFQEFFSSRGNDTIDGRGGNRDRLIYDNRDETAVTVNFLTGTATGSFAGTDSFSNIESVRGTSGADTFIGGTQAYTEYQGLDGIDTYVGGTGQDRLSFTFDNNRGGTGAISVDLLAQTATDGFGNLETFTGIEQVIANDTNDTLFGDNNANILIGLGGDDFIDGRGGNNQIFGGDGNDTLRSSGASEIFGENGNDTIFAGLGTSETLDGGTGIDTLNTTLFNGSYVVDLATGLTNFAGELFTNFENITAGNGNDQLFGFEVDNIMIGGGGNDRILAFRGNDTIEGGLGDDTLNGGEGNDNISGGDGADLVFGQDGNDVISGGDGNDQLFGEAGNDNISGGLGDDTIGAADGSDTINAGGGNDTAFGGEGNDTVRGGTGNDRLFGSGGSDFIDGEDGNDELFGETGSDTLLGGAGDDDMNGGGGNDFMNGESGNDRMFGGSNEDTMFGGTGNDLLNGQTQDDDLFGQSGNDQLFGGDGFDLLDGGSGNDVLFGGNQGDTLVGGLGVDTLNGGSGFDTFDFNSVAESAFGSADTIAGFDGAGGFGGDIIDVSSIDANTGIAGNQAFTFLGAVSSAVGLGFGAGALWVQEFGGQTRLYANVNNDAIIDLEVRINDGAGTTAFDYTASDFFA